MKKYLWLVLFVPVIAQAGFLDFMSYGEAIPTPDKEWVVEKDYGLDMEELGKFGKGVIESCSVVDENSSSWKFMQENKREETDIVLVSVSDDRYPCRYVAEHLVKHDFAMASLEDIPEEVAVKFAVDYPVFYLNDSFYRSAVYGTSLSLGYLRHEEMHLWQRAHNPYLEKFMWNDDKSETTDFGKFIEGCTEYYFPTGGPGYAGYADRYGRWRGLALEKGVVPWLERACMGNYLDFWRLRYWFGVF